MKFTVHTRTGHHSFKFLSRNAKPSHDIPYQQLAFFISNATCPGMPEFAKSEFSVIRLHEVKIMRRIRKQQWENFIFWSGWKPSLMHCLCPGLHLVTWCDTRKSTICRVHHSTKGKDGIYTEWYIHSLRLRRLLTKVVMLTWCPVPLNSMSSKIISPPPATPPWLRRIKGKVTGKGQSYTRPTKRVFNIHIELKL